jgi:hypothetical protein
MTRRTICILFSLALVVIGAGAFRLLRTSGADMVTSAHQFLGALDDTQRSRATMSFDDPARLKWHFIPLPERKGLQIKDMNADQRKAAFRLMQAGLSDIGYTKARQIMSLEAILRELEKTRKDGPIRDPERYYFTVFGRPEATGQWGWSVEGHHLSLNFTVGDNKVVSYTPSFLGSNPATVRDDLHIAGSPGKGTRVLAREEDLGFQLVKSLTDAQKEKALIAAKAPKELRGAGEPQAPTDPPAGLSAEKLTSDQLVVLRTLLETYCENMAADLGSARMAEIERAGLDKLHFAWAGALEPGVGHYYRVEGPTFQLEFINNQPDSAGNPANHIHTLWRDPRGDFGIKR